MAKRMFDISIHALVKRATKLRYCTERARAISIHALVKRATVKRIDKVANQAISIHALVKRATYILRALHDDGYFNPRPREKGDV